MHQWKRLLLTLFVVSPLVVFNVLPKAVAVASSSQDSINGDEDSENTSDEEDNADKNAVIIKGDRKSFTDKIRSIRSADGDYDLYFVKNGGPYSVPTAWPDSKIKKKSPEDFFKKAYAKGTPVSVTVDLNTESILSLDREPSSSSPSEDESPKKVPEDFPKELLFLLDSKSSPLAPPAASQPYGH